MADELPGKAAAGNRLINSVDVLKCADFPSTAAMYPADVVMPQRLSTWQLLVHQQLQQTHRTGPGRRFHYCCRAPMQGTAEQAAAAFSRCQ